MIAQLVAIRHPERVRTLTSIMSNTGNPDVRGASLATSLALFQPAPVERAAFIERSVIVAGILRGGGFRRSGRARAGSAQL